MKQYEVTHEIFVPCTGSWKMDSGFPREIDCRDPEDALRGWLSGGLWSFRREDRPDGVVAYLSDPPQRERYLFCEL